jgi:hypothetical protein
VRLTTIAEKWTKCLQPGCAHTLEFEAAREERIALADRGDLQGLCPVHSWQEIPWAMQVEIAEALPDAPARFPAIVDAPLPERMPVQSARLRGASALSAARRKPPHRCVSQGDAATAGRR